MKKLMIVLALLSGFAVGKGVDKDRYEDQLKSYNDEREPTLMLIAKIQQHITTARKKP